MQPLETERATSLGICRTGKEGYRSSLSVEPLPGARALIGDLGPEQCARNLANHGVASWDVGFDDCQHSYQVFRVPNARLQTDCNKYMAVIVKKELLGGPSFQRLEIAEPELPPEQSPAFGWGRIWNAPREVGGTIGSLLAGWPGTQ